MVYTLQGPVVQEDTWVLRGVDLVLPNDRSKSKSAYHSLRAGLRYEGNTDWVGSWSQADGGLASGTSRSIIDSASLNRRLRKGQIGVVEITKIGSPATLVGGSVIFHLERVGSRSGREQPFISTTASVDPDLRALADQINGSKLSKFSHAVQLVDETVTGSDLFDAAVYKDYDASAQTLSSTSNVDGNVSITVVAPAGKTTYVQVTAKVVMYTSSSAGRAYLTIGDGTTDHNETEAYAAANQQNNAVTMLTQEITTDTTYTVRLKKATGANIEVDDQLITAIAVSV